MLNEGREVYNNVVGFQPAVTRKIFGIRSSVGLLTKFFM